MKQFILKIISIVFVLLILISAIDYSSPVYWGNDIIKSKFNYLETLKSNEFDTYFIGSSIVNHQIDVKLFDKQTKTNAFNLGCPALSGIETLRFAHELIDLKKQSSLKTKNIFIGMPMLDFNKGKNINTTRGSYFFDTNALLSSFKNMSAENLAFSKMAKKSWFQLYIVIKNKFKLGTFGDLVKSIFVKTSKLKIKRFERTKGYIPLVVGQENESGLLRRNDFLKDTSILKTRLTEAKTYVAKRQNLTTLNTHLLNEVEYLIEKGRKNNVNIFVILFPKSPGIVYKKTMNVFAALDPSNTINLAKPGKYKDFYFSKYSYDKAHLNKRGAEELTRNLAKEYLSIR